MAGFLDNPRKLKGKVEITFSDSDVSKDVETTESGNSEISHPYEITGVSVIPSCKAATMDGNATMDGTFQMIDDTCILGWWGGELSSTSGTFSKETFIEITFPRQPVYSWTIIGDSKRGEYPVNFKVTFKNGTTVLGEKTVTGNTEVNVTLEVEYEAVTSVRLTITKWSKAKSCVKIMEFFNTLSESYEGSDLKSFDVIEERNPEDGGYGVSSDTASVTIFNKDRKFDRGYLKELMLPGRRLKFYVGLSNGEYELIGTFYSDEWKAEEDSQWVKVTCVDKLLSLQDKQYLGFTLTPNASLFDIAKDILESAGLRSGQYEISTVLKSETIEKAFLGKMSVWNALLLLTYAGRTRTYIDRDGKLVLRCKGDEEEQSNIEITPSNMFSFKSSIKNTGFANRIEVPYCDVTLSEKDETAAETTVTLKGYETLDLTLNFDSDFTGLRVESDNRDFEIGSFKEGVNACSFRIRNTLSIPASGKIIVKGKKIVTSFKSVIVSDERGIKAQGLSEYHYPESPLIQDAGKAKEIGEELLAKMKKGEGVITTSWRGSPELDLGNIYKVKDRFGEKTELINEYNKFSFDGGLKVTSRGRKEGE